VNGVEKREGTLDDAHWPQAGPTQGMTTPEVSAVTQGVRGIMYTAGLLNTQHPKDECFG
jgi:hypothetical protein